jgi:hypothetical protein
MNPNILLTEGEQDFLAQEKGITEAVIRVIGVAKKENALIRDEQVSALVVEACKAAVGKTQQFKALIQGARRPYITHAVELLGILSEVNLAVTGIEDVLAASRAEHDPETAEAMQTELKVARVHATELIADFKRWLYTSDASYMFASDRTLEMPQPASPDVAKTDMLRCPRWVITHLVEARRTELKTETAWRQINEELNITKKKLTQATGLDEIKAKDAIIKKLNASLQIMYRDVEEKTKELEEVRAKALQLATQVRTVNRGSGVMIGSPVPPEGQSSDSETIKQLRAEVARLKAAAEFAPPAPARARGLTLRPAMLQSLLPPAVLAPPPLNAPPGGMGNDDLPPPPPPEEDAVPYSEAKHWMTAENKRIALASLLTDPEMTFVDVLGRAIAGGNDADACASYLISLYQSQDTLMLVLEHLIYTEVNRCKSVNTLFRGEELSSRVLRSYVRMNGFEYIRKVLGALVEEVAVNNYFFEVDPNRANPTMDLKVNFEKLEELTQRFLDVILDSYISVPPEFLRLCKCIYTHSAVKFANEDFEQLVVSGFMFLRFICPAIAAPESFKLTPIETPEARRTLLLVGKILQNLANGVEFKEPYLQDMNRFLTKNAQRVTNFFQKLRTYPVEIDGNAPYLVDISRSVVGRKEKIKTTATAENAQDKLWECEIVAPLFPRLKTLLTAVQTPVSVPVSAATSEAVAAPSAAPNRSDLVKSFANVMFDNSDLLSKVLIMLPHVATDLTTTKKSVAENMAILAYHHDQIGVLTRVCVQNEVVPSAYEFLHSSFTKHVFTSFALSFCGSWLASVLGAHLTPIIASNTFIETDPLKVTDPAVKAKYNRDEMLGKVKMISNAILQSFVQSLASAPRPLWLFCNTVSLNTSQDVGQFLLLNFVVPFLENPSQYASSFEKPKKEASRALQIIADILRNYANSSNVFVDNVPMTQAAWSDRFLENIGSWSRSLPGYLIDARANVSQDTLTQCMLGLTTFFNENIAKLEQLLEGLQTTHTVVYGIHEFVDSLVAPPPKPVDPALAAVAAGSGKLTRTASGNMVDPKAAAKKAKEDEKRLKEEEEKRKKEDKKKKEEDEKRKKEEDKRKKEEARGSK